jgi:BRCA1-associated protein
MYSLVVRGKKGGRPAPAPEQGAGTSASAQASPTPSGAASPRAAAEVDQVAFSAGNPRVEHITGVVHLYRHIPADGGAHPSGDDGGGGGPLPEGRGQQVCVLALPPDMGFSEFCAFLGAYFARVRDVRLVRRDTATSSCLVLLTFDSPAAADGFYTAFNGQPFCLLEPELTCQLVFVKGVDLSNEAAGSSGAPAKAAAAAAAEAGKPPPLPRPPAGATELPSCPVCLERLDAHVSGVVTTVCNHKFHNDCLRRWGDTSCPVCRYCQHPQEATSRCAACRAAADLWICLICGHVGCGRYRGSHAHAHWGESGHGYALELETQRVWDYASDAYVHRLVRSKTDGKLVEVPAPGAQERGGREGGSGGECSGGGGGGGGGGGECWVDPEVEEALVLRWAAVGLLRLGRRGGRAGAQLAGVVGTFARRRCALSTLVSPPPLPPSPPPPPCRRSKLDALSVEYNHLLVTQLESQRQHFEGLMVRQRVEADAAAAAADGAVGAAREAAAAAAAAAAEADRRRRQAEDRLGEAQKRAAKAQEERQFLKQLNDTLLANQKEFAAKLKAAEAAAAAREAAAAELQEQVRDLMVFIEARQTVQSGGGGELEGATVLPVPEGAGAGRRGGGGRGRRK